MLELHDGFARTSRLLVDLEHDGPADHQAGEVGGARFAGRCRRDDFAVAHHGDPIGNVNHFAELVRDENNRLAFFGETAQDFEEALGLLRGQNSRGLIHDQQPRAAIERFQDLDSLLHADGKIRDPGRRVDLQPISIRQRADLLAGLGDIHGAEGADGLVAKDDVLGDGQWRNQHEMLVHHADAEPDRVRRAMDGGRVAVDDDLAAVGADQSVDDVHQRRLSGPVLSQKRVDLAPLDDQVHVVIRPELSEGLDDPAKLQRRRRAYEYLVSPSAPVLRVPFLILVMMSRSLALMSAETFESHWW